MISRGLKNGIPHPALKLSRCTNERGEIDNFRKEEVRRFSKLDGALTQYKHQPSISSEFKNISEKLRGPEASGILKDRLNKLEQWRKSNDFLNFNLAIEMHGAKEEIVPVRLFDAKLNLWGSQIAPSLVGTFTKGLMEEWSVGRGW